jgi:hypothetical protein
MLADILMAAIEVTLGLGLVQFFIAWLEHTITEPQQLRFLWMLRFRAIVCR